MANPNIINVSTILGNTSAITVSTTTSNVVSNPASSGYIYKINSLTVANINTFSSPVNISLEYNSADANTYLARNIVVPANSSIVLIGKDTGLYLLENSSLQLTSNYNNSLTAVVSFEQIG